MSLRRKDDIDYTCIVDKWGHGMIPMSVVLIPVRRYSLTLTSVGNSTTTGGSAYRSNLDGTEYLPA